MIPSPTPVSAASLAPVYDVAFEQRWKAWQERAAASDRRFRARLRVVLPLLIVVAVGVLVLLIR